jgi:hypothetical protein
MAIDFATSRAHSMKRSTTGLKVRFFSAKIARGYCRMGKSTGKIFNAWRLGLSHTEEFGVQVILQQFADVLEA